MGSFFQNLWVHFFLQKIQFGVILSIYSTFPNSEGFANQTSTRSAERIMIAQPIEDNDDDFGDEEDEAVDQTENKLHDSYLGCCFFVAILFVAAILVGRALTR